jgi:magnesium-transporting ATPase (P-type)
LPLAIVLGVAIVKEAIEDWKRHKQDVEVNNRAVDVFDHQENKFITKVWKDVRVGDIIIVSKDQYFPAGEMGILDEAADLSC